MSDFKQLEAWKQSMQLVDQVYDLCKLLPTDERYGIISQMQRCSISIPANLAEGCGRDSTKDFLRHVAISRGSLAELSTFLTFVQRRRFVTPESVTTIEEQLETCAKLLGGLRRSLRRKLNL
ncbi:four helix bundle protein [Bythopirellula goksoeyrii]|uniref:Four helix bundle protein n=1 Tax=Bythopirellula goksoeyrii TaxID=1400387 RepID=A0A5B9QJC9_9BACT|nr:hypothetical protein Pr1d_51700 [Bythopirellula goksoeyrii]